MKTSTIVNVLVAAGFATAAPTTGQPAKFTVMSLRSASPVHFGKISAAQSNLFLHLPSQNATCNSQPKYDATFYIKDTELFLYTPPNAPSQKVYVDRSGMG